MKIVSVEKENGQSQGKVCLAIKKLNVRWMRRGEDGEDRQSIFNAQSTMPGYIRAKGLGDVICSLTSIQEARGKRSSHLLVSLSAIAQDTTKAIKTQFRNCT